MLQNECTADWWVEAHSENKTQAWKDYNVAVYKVLYIW